MRVTILVLSVLVSSVALAKTPAPGELSFEVNQGQTDARVKFLSRQRDSTLFLTPTEVTLQARTDTVRMTLRGANGAPEAKGEELQSARSNYFIGADRSKWRRDIPHYGRVRFANVYPGIDVVYYGKDGELEYDWVVQPGANPAKIRMQFAGARKVRVDSLGDLVLETAGGEIREKKPVIYQENTNGRVAGHYVLLNNHEVGFEIAHWDKRRKLVIDPVLVYASYFGGTHTEEPNAIAVDGNGNAYITGYTASSNFPTVNAEQPVNNALQTAFVSKVSADGSKLIYSTYLGGSTADFGIAIAVDTSGSAFVTGWTRSKDFPVVNAYQGTYPSKDLGYSGFVTKLSPSGGALVFSTYLGGDASSQPNGIAVDGSGNAYIAGGTDSSDFATTAGVIHGGPNPKSLGYPFLVKMSGTGSLVYSTFLNNGDLDGIASVPNAVAADGSGNAYVTGYTAQKNFTLVNPVQTTYSGSQAVFVMKVNPSASAIIYSTYLGGGNEDEGIAIAADSSGNTYVTGRTSNMSFPLVNPIQKTFGGGSSFYHAFVMEIAAAGSKIVYSTYLGGSESDAGVGIAVDAAGHTWVAGTTGSSDFPIVDSLGTPYRGEMLFLSEVAGGGSNLLFSSYLASVIGYQGGSGRAAGMALDASGNAYLVADNSTSNGPADSTALGGSSSILVFKVGVPAGPVIAANGVVNGASFQAPIVPGSWATILGSGLSAVTDTWDNLIVNGKLPTAVDQVSVTVGGQAAFVYYVSGGQINFIVPDVPLGSQPVVVTNSVGKSNTENVTVAATAPAFFLWPNNQAVATRQDFSYAVANGTFAGTTTVAAKPGDVIILWGTGFGPTSPPAPVGMETPSTTTYNTASAVSVSVGGKPATVYGAALAPVFAGLYQIAIQIPASLANGEYPVVAEIAGTSSPQTTMIAIHQ